MWQSLHMTLQRGTQGVLPSPLARYAAAKAATHFHRFSQHPSLFVSFLASSLAKPVVSAAELGEM